MARRNPAKLAEKLLAIRTKLGFSQRGLIRAMGFEEELTQAEISMFESGRRIPNLLVLRRYAQMAGIWTDYLIEDEWHLPIDLPSQMNNRKKSQDN
jgi:transcriptional regulator with XRE-family HTH domain